MKFFNSPTPQNHTCRGLLLLPVQLPCHNTFTLQKKHSQKQASFVAL